MGIKLKDKNKRHKKKTTVNLQSYIHKELNRLAELITNNKKNKSKTKGGI